MIKSALFKVWFIACYTFSPSFGKFVNTTSVKSFLFAAKRLSSHFSTSSYEKSAVQQVRYPSKQTRGNLKESSLVSKPYRTSQLSASNLSRTDFVVCVMEHCHGKWLCVAFPRSVFFWLYFKHGTVLIGQLLLVTFSISRFPRLQLLITDHTPL